jgi:hypothetical protein
MQAFFQKIPENYLFALEDKNNTLLYQIFSKVAQMLETGK